MGTAKKPERFTVRLDCGHVVPHVGDPPNLGDEIYCARHRCLQYIDTLQAEYRIVCKTCPVRKSFGAAELDARMAASRHVRRCPGHVVHVMCSNEVLHVYGVKRGVEMLPFRDPNSIDPPF